MAEWVLFGLLIGIFLFSTTIVCWQLVMTFLDVRGILKTVHHITDEVQPTIHEVNEILRKTNLVMDEAGKTYQNAGQKAKRTKSGLEKIKHKLLGYKESLQTGVETAVQVYQNGDNGHTPAPAVGAPHTVEKGLTLGEPTVAAPAQTEVAPLKKED